MYPIVHCSTIYNSQNTEATQMSINRRMEKEVVVYIHNGILLSHKRNAFESVLLRWMNLEPIIQSEESQKKKNKYCILTHIYEIQGNGTDEIICRVSVETQTQRTDLWTQWRGRKERVECMEKVTWKHTLPHVKQIANGNCYMTPRTQTGAL